MRKTLCFGVVAILGLALCGADLDAQKKDKKGRKAENAASPQDYVQIQNVKELTGKLASADAKSIAFQLETSHMEPNPGFKGYKAGGGSTALQRRYAEIMRDYAEIARARNPAERSRRMAELQRDMAALQREVAKASGAGVKPPKDGPFKVVTDTKDFNLDLGDKAIVRWNKPPFVYDDKGNPKTYTKEELAKLRGKDAKLPGYEGKYDDLAPGQTVRLFLTPPPKGKAKEKLDEIEGVGNVARPTINMILILDEGPALSFGPPDKKKKK